VRALLLVVTALIGFALGIIGGFVQAARTLVDTPWGTVSFPWGTVLVLVVLVLAIRGGAWWVRSRLGGWLLFTGWILATILMALETPSGDTAISAGGRQWAYLLIGVVVGAACATFPVIDRSSLTIEERPGS
jgi:hypothetical protein